MQASVDCFPCFFAQALGAVRLITPNETEALAVLRRVSGTLSRHPFNVPPPVIGREVYKIISEETGVADPFHEVKKQCTRLALDLYPEFKKAVRASRDPLLTAARLAIAGNVIDFGSHTPFDLGRDARTILNQPLAIDDYSDFRRKLESAGSVLYLADNAGETVFDRFLIEEIPNPVIYAVRSRPIINDAVIEDAVAAGLGDAAVIMDSGSDAPGTCLELCSDEFLDIYRRAELIISKGQGNYECLSEEERPLVFLLKAKCAVVARDLGVPRGAIAIKRNWTPSF